MAVSHAFSSPIADGTGTQTIWFGNTTVTVNATENVRPGDWNSAHNQFMTMTGNTAGQSTFSGSNIVMGGGANITLSGVNATRFDIVGGAGAAGNTGSISAGTTRGTLGEVVFSNSNGISFGIDGQTLTAQHNALTSQSNQNITAANGGFAFQTLSFSNVNGVSFGTSAGSAITASVAAQTNQTGGIYVTAQSTGQSSSSTYDLRTLSFVPDGIISAGWSNGSFRVSATQSNQNVTAANGGFAFQTLSFSNVNGISFGTSAGSAITASHNGLTTQTNQQLTLFATGNTTQSSTGTTNASSVIFRGEGVASVGITNGSIVISVPAGAPSPVNFSAGTTSGNLGSVVFSNSNGVSFGLNGSTITASAGGRTVSFEQFFPAVGARSLSHLSMGQNTLGFYPFDLNNALTASVLAIPVSIQNTTIASSSGQVGYTLSVALYSQGTNTTRIDSFWSTSYTMAASNSSNVSRAVTWISGLVNSTSYGTNSSTSAGVNLSSMFHGGREFQLGFATSLSGGRYWFAAANSSSLAGTSNSVLGVSVYAFWPNPTNDFFRIGSQSQNASIDGGLQSVGLGAYSVTTGGFPATVGFSEMNPAAQPFPLALARLNFY